MQLTGARWSRAPRAVILSTHDHDQAFALVCAGVLTRERLSAVYDVSVAVETTTSGRRVCYRPLA